MPRGALFAVAACAALLAAGAAAGRTGTAAPRVATYPSAVTIPPTGKLPAGGGRAITLNEPVGGDDAALVVVSGAHQVGLTVNTRGLGPVGVQVRFRHFVRFGAALVPDALLPWDGSKRPVEQPNQPLSIEVSVPYGTKPGAYRTTATVLADAGTTVLPLTINVFKVTLPKLGAPNGNLLSAFAVGPQAYVNKAISLFGLKSADQIRVANASLFSFLSAYRLSPDNWGYGNPHGQSGYAPDRRWWKDSAGNMTGQLASAQFPDLWIPLSNNRWRPGTYIAGLSPSEPESWCTYLGNVKKYWTLHEWLAQGQIPYLYPYDEPGDTHTSLLTRQAAALHRCWPGAKMLVTGTPDSATKRLWDGKRSDDVDIWATVLWRYYGFYTSPGREKFGNRARQNLTSIDTVRSRGKKIFAYTYCCFPGFPSFSAAEPLSDPRMFVLWTALEGIDGILYGEGSTTYGPGDPLAGVAHGGEFVLIYPGNPQPIASARIEQIRSGIEDWDVFDVVRRRFGAAKVRQILGAHGLFSADASGVKLACVVGCDLKGVPPQAWPRWSHDSTTAGRIEAARAAALELASS
jgi:Domain of unknown function (DUF4091)